MHAEGKLWYTAPDTLDTPEEDDPDLFDEVDPAGEAVLQLGELQKGLTLLAQQQEDGTLLPVPPPAPAGAVDVVRAAALLAADRSARGEGVGRGKGGRAGGGGKGNKGRKGGVEQLRDANGNLLDLRSRAGRLAKAAKKAAQEAAGAVGEAGEGTAVTPTPMEEGEEEGEKEKEEDKEEGSSSSSSSSSEEEGSSSEEEGDSSEEEGAGGAAGPSQPLLVSGRGRVIKRKVR